MTSRCNEDGKMARLVDDDERCSVCLENFSDVDTPPISEFPNCIHGNLVCELCKNKQVDVLRNEGVVGTLARVECPMCRSEISTVVCCGRPKNDDEEDAWMDEGDSSDDEPRMIPCPFLPNLHPRIREDHVGRHLRKAGCAGKSRLKLYRNRFCDNHWFRNPNEACIHRCKSTRLAEREQRRRRRHHTVDESSSLSDEDSEGQ